MSAIHYKFSSSNEYKNVTFDGMSISLFDLKKAIMVKQKLKSTELDLHITNAQTLQVYKDESVLIPKNTAVLVRRIPLGPVRDSKVYIVKRTETNAIAAPSTQKTTQESEVHPKMTFDELTKASNLAEANATEEDKIKAAIHQSTNDYDPSKFYRPPKPGTYKYNAATASNASMSYVRCYRCNQSGHYAMQCPIPKTESDKTKMVRHATGIPRSHMVEVKKDSKGAMLTTDGRYVVPLMDKKGYDTGKKERPPFLPTPNKIEEEEEDEPIPDELICPLCKDLMVDAVVIPCCGNSYCDDCIRNALLDSDTHQCPTCHKENISPDSLIANKFLRQAVNKFKTDTGIAKKRTNAPVWPRPAPVEKPKPKVTPVVASKVSYGPPKSKTNDVRTPVAGGYVVKAKTDQIASNPYSVARRGPETGSSSPHDPNQPIRIKLGLSDNGPKSETPSGDQPMAQSTPQESGGSSIPASTPQSESYTFNSTPDTGEEKPKASVFEPVPPGTSPPVAKVVRSLMDGNTEIPASKPASLVGIHPLATSSKSFTSIPPAVSLAPTAVIDSLPALVTSATQLPPSAPVIQPPVLEPQRPLPATIPMEKPQIVYPPNSEGLGLLGEAPVHLVAAASKKVNANSSVATVTAQSAPKPVNISIPALSKPVPTLHPPVTIPPPVIPPSFPPGLTSIPPPSIPPTSGVNIFQHPPPPFPFNLLPPPPGFPMPPPGRLPIPPSLASVPPPGFPLAQRNMTPAQPVNTSLPPPLTRGARDPGRRRSLSRSPRRRSDRRTNKSKLDIMSDEFTEKNSKTRYNDKRRSRRSRSRSLSYTSASYSSSSYSSSSRSSSSYSSYSDSSWSSSSGSSNSQSASPRKRKHRQKTKDYGKKRKSRSRTPPRATRKTSQKRRSRSRKRDDSRRKRRSTSFDRRRRYSRSPSPRRDRRRSPHRGARDKSRSPQSRSNRHEQTGANAFPSIPVIGAANSAIPGLPSKEQADYERDQALYAHYRQVYERDWYERGVMPPPPFDRFIQSRFSRSPSPPGTRETVLPPPDKRNEGWRPQEDLLTPSGLPPSELYQLQNNILREEQYYDDVQARLHAMATGNVGGRNFQQGKKTTRPRRYNEDQGGRRGDQGRSRDRYSGGGRYNDDKKRGDGRRDRDGKYRDGRRGDAPQQIPSNDGDATPVRDERPPPEEVLLQKAEEKIAPRRAGDTVLASTTRRSRSDKSSSKRDSSKTRSESRIQKEEDKSRSGSKSRRDDGHTRSDSKSKADAGGRNRKDDSRSHQGDKKRREEEKTSSKMRESDSKRTVSSSKSERKSESSSSSKKSSGKRDKDQSRDRKRRSEKSNSSSTKSGSKLNASKDDNSKPDKGQPIQEVGPEESTEKKDEDTRKKQKEDIQEKSDVNQTENVIPKVTDDSSRKNIDEPPDFNPDSRSSEVHNAEDEEKAVVKEEGKSPTQEKTDSLPPVERVEKRSKLDEELPPNPTPGSNIPDVVPEVAKEVLPGDDPVIQKEDAVITETKADPVNINSPVNNEEPVKREKSAKRDAAARKERKKQKRAERKKKSSKDTDPGQVEPSKQKVIEYDGSAPPPTGDEMIKITIPKSRWEESDEEHKSDKPAAETSEPPDKDPPKVKGRRIKIKRKPLSTSTSDVKPTVEVQGKVEEKLVDVPASKSSDSESSKVKDARMVITLRRNSKREEDTRGRRVSLEEPEDLDRVEEVAKDQRPAEVSSVVSVKGKAIKVTAMRSSRLDGEEYPNDDVIDLMHPSGLSDVASDSEVLETKKSHKKKKKKKKKRKNRHRSEEDPTSEPKTTERDSDVTPEREPKRKVVEKSRYKSSDEEDLDRGKASSRQRDMQKRHRDISQEERRDRKRHKRDRRGASGSDYEQSSPLLRHKEKRSHQSRERTVYQDVSRDRKQRKRDKRHKHKSQRWHRDAEESSSFDEDETEYKRSRKTFR